MMSFPFFIFQIKKNDFSFSSYTYKNKNTEDIASITSFHSICIYKKNPWSFNLFIYLHEYKGTSVSFEIHTCTYAYVRAAYSTGAYELSYNKFRFFFFINYDVIYIKNLLTNLQVSFFISLSLWEKNPQCWPNQKATIFISLWRKPNISQIFFFKTENNKMHVLYIYCK